MSSLDIILPRFYGYFVKIRHYKYTLKLYKVNLFSKFI